MYCSTRRAHMCIVLCAICRIKCSILVLDPFTKLWVIWKASHQRRFWIGTQKQKYKLACPHISIMKGNVLNRKIYTLLNYHKHTRIVWTLYLSGSQFWNLLSFFWIFKIYYWKSFFTLHLLDENDAALWGQVSFLSILIFMFSSNNYRQLLGKALSFNTFSYNLFEDRFLEIFSYFFNQNVLGFKLLSQLGYDTWYNKKLPEYKHNCCNLIATMIALFYCDS